MEHNQEHCQHSDKISDHPFVVNLEPRTAPRTTSGNPPPPPPPHLAGRGAGHVRVPPTPSTSAPVQTPAPTTPAGPSALEGHLAAVQAQDAVAKAEFERHVAEREKEKEDQLQGMRSRHEEARRQHEEARLQLEMDQNVEFHKLMEDSRKKEEDDKKFRRTRGWD